MVDLSLLLAQIGVILVLARFFGWLFRLIHQPPVVGEMVAGVVLGPSVFGWLAPTASAALFPPGDLPVLNALSQVGLLVFMFLVGLELDLGNVRRRGRTALLVSQTAIILPFLLGIGLSVYLHPQFGVAGVPFTHFALFMGTALSVTAFPVLARILMDLRLTRTNLGTVAMVAAAVGDVTAWCLLAVMVTVVRSSAVEVPLTITLAGSVIYVAAVVLAGPRLLRWLFDFLHRRGTGPHNTLAINLLLVFASALITDQLGIHAVFGAFLVGAITPPQIARWLATRLEGITVVLLLPLFFAFTGLRTSIALLSGATLWGYFMVILAVAVAGKFVGAAAAARMTGMTWRNAVALGWLMNTRGLMELVILNIGYDIGVISQEIFSMMVLMALVTTFMTTPLVKLSLRNTEAADPETRLPHPESASY